MTPVDLIIPDAGPLISLAHAGRLDLIDVFSRPVAVLDVVRLECLKKADSPDHLDMRRWFEAKGNTLRIIETPIRGIYEQALEDEASGRRRHATRGLGDAAFGWLLPNLDAVALPGAVPLVLTEDRTLSVTLADQQIAHVLSTRAWLVGLQNAGVIESADAVIAQIGRHGRVLSALRGDVPALVAGESTDWIDSANP